MNVLYAHSGHYASTLYADKGHPLVNNSGMEKPDDYYQGEHIEFTERLEKALAYAGITGSIRDKAKKLGISKSFMDDLLRAKKMPGAAKSAEIAILTGVNSDWLNTGRGLMTQVLAEGVIDISHLSEEKQEAVKAIIKSYE